MTRPPERFDPTLQVPPDIIEAAVKIREWVASQNLDGTPWQLMGLSDAETVRENTTRAMAEKMVAFAEGLK